MSFFLKYRDDRINLALTLFERSGLDHYADHGLGTRLAYEDAARIAQMSLNGGDRFYNVFIGACGGLVVYAHIL